MRQPVFAILAGALVATASAHTTQRRGCYAIRRQGRAALKAKSDKSRA
jgi:hypothetical protein